MARGSGQTGFSQDRGSSSRYGFPLPSWLSLAPQPGPTRPGNGGQVAGQLLREPGQVRGLASRGLGLGPSQKGRAGPGEQVS